ncbi:MAG: hypothetical protein IJG55_10110, partial [Synergistaceae bacterium]|nr:hypothetical protein [Synergistaceae bacterium]
PDRAADSRYVHRGAFHWDDAEKRNDENTTQGKIFRAVHKLVTLRDNHSVFANDADTWLIETGNNQILGIGRYEGSKTKKEKMLAFFNFSGKSQTFGTNENLTGIFDYHNMLTGEKFTGNPDGTITLEPYGFLWVLAEM